jgi:hypothetical protein
MTILNKARDVQVNVLRHVFQVAIHTRAGAHTADGAHVRDIHHIDIRVEFLLFAEAGLADGAVALATAQPGLRWHIIADTTRGAFNQQ